MKSSNKRALTLVELDGIISAMRRHAIPACVVGSKKEAMEMTRNDRTGRTWKVGDEFYRAEAVGQTINIFAGECHA